MIFFYKRIKKTKKINFLKKNCQKKGIVLKMRIMSPKKPNSGKRPIVKCVIFKKKNIIAHIPGIGHNLRQYANVLINGNNVKDLPYVHYSLIRGVYDLYMVLNKTKRKSIYGIKTNILLKKKLCRKFR